LAKEVEIHGDLDVVISVGEMSDAEFVQHVRVVEADITTTERGTRYVYVPWIGDKKIMNSKVFEIMEYVP
jgi:hypothetical protein